MVIVKRGAKGCTVVTREAALDCPAYPVEVRDQIGCGDSFNAAFILAQLSQLPVDRCGMFANAVGAAKACKMGPGRNMPYPQEISALLSRFNVPLAFDPAKGLKAIP
jgi:sugar/nucleoside kinase (ribokinase family)